MTGGIMDDKKAEKGGIKHTSRKLSHYCDESTDEKENQEMQSAPHVTSVPEGFTLAMACVDCLPVLFFSISACVLALRFDSRLFRAGIFLVILAGALKAGWKFVIALLHRDIPFLSRQMRFLMPAGFLLVLISLFADRSRWSFTIVIRHITGMPSLIFFLCGIAGLVVLTCFIGNRNIRNAKANWKEQIINSISQFCIMMGIVL